MRKRDIVKLVFAVIFLIAALIGCVLSISVRQSIAEGSEKVDSGGEAVGFVFAAFFLALFAVIGVGCIIIT